MPISQTCNQDLSKPELNTTIEEFKVNLWNFKMSLFDNLCQHLQISPSKVLILILFANNAGRNE
ncbi:hypothetical protein ACX27_00490 [Nostoc piscinale CENA21]|uniref:Uncharacterized protein n=1 Tax=Nostoc piscinale CENA21 TaxID=224013 RepID=A0A0M4TT84_9NOSO|nr:hypothetical protein ACX27_00490 [Nostoc piscinale CENA21]